MRSSSELTGTPPGRTPWPIFSKEGPLSQQETPDVERAVRRLLVVRARPVTDHFCATLFGPTRRDVGSPCGTRPPRHKAQREPLPKACAQFRDRAFPLREELLRAASDERADVRAAAIKACGGSGSRSLDRPARRSRPEVRSGGSIELSFRNGRSGFGF